MGQKQRNALFLSRYCSAASAQIHAAVLLPSLPSSLESCQIYNPFSIFLGSPKIPFCWVQFLSSRMDGMRLIFCSHSTNFLKTHAALVQASFTHHCELPGVGNFSCSRSFVRRTINFFYLDFRSKKAKRSFFSPNCSATSAQRHAAQLLPSFSP